MLRLLLKKVTIKSKSQSPKLTGALCDVPTEITNVSSLLPRQSDSIGFAVIQLSSETGE